MKIHLVVNIDDLYTGLAIGMTLSILLYGIDKIPVSLLHFIDFLNDYCLQVINRNIPLILSLFDVPSIYFRSEVFWKRLIESKPQITVIRGIHSLEASGRICCRIGKRKINVTTSYKVLPDTYGILW